MAQIHESRVLNKMPSNIFELGIHDLQGAADNVKSFLISALLNS